MISKMFLNEIQEYFLYIRKDQEVRKTSEKAVSDH